MTILGSLVRTATSVAGAPSTLALVAGPSVSWNVFDHGKIMNNVRVQDARLQQVIVSCQDTVREADDAATALATALERESILHDAELTALRSLTLANTIYREGYSDFQRVLDAQRALSAQQDAYVVNRGNAVFSLISLYAPLAAAGTPGSRSSTRPPVNRWSNSPTGAICCVQCLRSAYGAFCRRCPLCLPDGSASRPATPWAVTCTGRRDALSECRSNAVDGLKVMPDRTFVRILPGPDTLLDASPDRERTPPWKIPGKLPTPP